MNIIGINSTVNSMQVPTFKRKPNIAEMEVYTKSIKAGLNLLDKKLDVIIHNSSAPSIWHQDVGIGSLFSNTTEKKLMPFLKAHGVTGIQQEPDMLRKRFEYSPYSPESSARNILAIPLEKLASSKYGNILSNSLFAKIVKKADKNGYVNYKKVSKEFEIALSSAYKSFISKGIMKEEFSNFKEKNNDLEKAAIFHVLNENYKKYWEEWSEIDKRLYSPRNAEEEQLANERIKEIKEKYKDRIDYFMFQQFILDKESKDLKTISKKIGINIIGDSPVATPQADEWINQDLFLKGKAIGCPPDYFSKEGQRWGFKYFDPKYIFNKDGSLGPAGKLLKQKYDEYFKRYSGGLRVDHVIGLVDPFVYTVDSTKMTSENSGRLYSDFNGVYKKKEEEYADLIKKIILKSMEEHGLTKKDLICEDLGDPNPHTMKVMNDMDLSGIAVTQFNYRGAETPKRNVIMPGSHDNTSYIEYTDELFSNPERKGDLDLRAKFLSEDTVPPNTPAENKALYKEKLTKDKKEFMKASFAELFTSPARRVQIFFSDFFGIGKTYNRPGTTKGNWELRIGDNFVNDYYKAVSEGKAPNLANAIATALRQRGLDKNNKALMQDLDNSAKILAEV